MTHRDEVDRLRAQLHHFAMPGNLDNPACEVKIVLPNPGYLSKTAEYFEWLGENVGKCMVDWGLVEENPITDDANQDMHQIWQFRDKNKAMLFKLRWVGV